MITAWLKRFFHALSIWIEGLGLFVRMREPPQEPVEYPPFERKLSRIPSIDVERKKEQIRIAEVNRARRTKFSNAEFFKRRQPTTARMLWKPNAKIEEDS